MYNLIVSVTDLIFQVGVYVCDANSGIADKKFGGDEDKIDYSKWDLGYLCNYGDYSGI